MKLTICYDGQFYIGLIENISENKYKAFKYIFGNEPKDQEVFDFVNMNLLDFIKNNEKHDGIPIQQKKVKKINPKRLQRKVAKELKKPSISSKAEEAIKAEIELRKKEKSVTCKRLKEERKNYIRNIKVQKSKNKHRGR
ncbi:YjdF family protein [Lysinibacillus xylanilyticus]|uniref:YjdF family protein n=1 Tax=Lysinibacillus xylanilyticus TaxID=582475 RepID=UPI003CFFCFF4